MKIVLLDNYDSFTYNLAQYIAELVGVNLTVCKSDTMSVAQLEEFDKIVISPGPGIPSDHGKILEVITRYSGQLPVLGICLGLQAIYQAFGGKLLLLDQVRHGVSSEVLIKDQDDPLFRDIPSPFIAGRYHSWACHPDFLPESLEITAWDDQGMIMSCRHKNHLTYGVQFHPESILTPHGKQLIRNFVERIHYT